MDRAGSPVLVASYGRCPWRFQPFIGTQNAVLTSEEYTLPEDCILHYIRPCNFNEDRICFSYALRDHQYKTPYARQLPFLTARGRVMISKIMEPIVADVVRCHTDGIIFKNLSDALAFGNNLGSLKYEGYCENCIVTNCRKAIGIFH